MVEENITVTAENDERVVAWWNSMSVVDRIHWMVAAGDTGRPSDAWRAYQAAMAECEKKAKETPLWKVIWNAPLDHEADDLSLLERVVARLGWWYAVIPFFIGWSLACTLPLII